VQVAYDTRVANGRWDNKAVGSRQMTLNATDASFENHVLVRADRVAVSVDLWAPWCGPMLEAAAGAAELVKADV